MPCCCGLTFNIQEKHKEKKRKKEKRQGKEKKERDRSKDRYKEKKDRKEKHKDYKKKDRRKGKRRIRNERPDKQSRSPDGNLLGEDNHKPEQINHFKDFNWGVTDEQKVAANRKVDNLKFPAQKSIRSLGAATAMVKESVASHRTFPSSTEEINQSKFKVLDREIKDVNQTVKNFNIPVQKSIGTMDKESSTSHKAFPSSTVAPQRRIDSMERLADNFHNSTPKRNEGMASTSAMPKEKNAMDKLVPMLISTGQRGNGGVSLPMEISDRSIRRRFKSPSPATSVEMDDYNNNKVAIVSNNSVQRMINGMGQSAKRLSVQKNVNSGLPVKMEGRAETNRSIANKDRMVARNDRMGGLVENDANNGIKEGKAKNKERGADGKSEEKFKNQDLDKDKDKGKHKGKEKEKAKLKEKVKKDEEQKKPRDDRKKNQLDALRLKPLSSQIHNAKNNPIDDNIKKRKEIEKNSSLNGKFFDIFIYIPIILQASLLCCCKPILFVFYHYICHDIADANFRPNKIQNTNFSTPLREENRTLESSDLVFPPLKPEPIGNKLPLRTIDQEEHITNGVTKTQSSSALSMYPVAAKTGTTNTKVGATPHPDCVYLNRLYTIPKVDGYPEYDDQEWVFSSCHDRKSNSKLQANANDVPQVWSETIQIESANVLALPYVIPF